MELTISFNNVFFFSLNYIGQDISGLKESTAIFNVSYLLSNDGPHFSPNLEIDSEPNFFGLVSSLLEDMVEIGSHMKRIADGYPPYNVIFFI